MAKPTMGYRTRTEACLTLQAAGKRPLEIAEFLGVPVANVYGLLAASSGKRKCGRGDVGSVQLPRVLLEKLRPHAEARQISVGALVRDLVATIADDDLVKAVLD